MHIKITLNHYISTGVSEGYMAVSTKGWQGTVTSYSLPCGQEYGTVYLFLINHSMISFLDINSGESKVSVHINPHKRMFTVDLVARAPNWEQPKNPTAQ